MFARKINVRIVPTVLLAALVIASPALAQSTNQSTNRFRGPQGPQVKSPEVMPVPVTAKSTVWLPVTALDAVAVTVTAVAPVSLAELVLTERLTVGAGVVTISRHHPLIVPMSPEASSTGRWAVRPRRTVGP